MIPDPAQKNTLGLSDACIQNSHQKAKLKVRPKLSKGPLPSSSVPGQMASVAELQGAEVVENGEAKDEEGDQNLFQAGCRVAC